MSSGVAYPASSAREEGPVPERLLVGGIGESWRRACRQAGGAPRVPERLARLTESDEIVREFEVPGLWGLEPIEDFAAHQAMGIPYPAPASPDEPPDLGTILEYSERLDSGASERFRELLGRNADGIYVPFDVAEELDVGPPVLGDAASLRKECLALSRDLGISEDRELALNRLREEDTPATGGPTWLQLRYESLGCLLLLQACELALEADQGITLQWRYGPRPSHIALNDRTAHYLGLTEFSQCRVVDQGARVAFSFRSGDRYVVPSAFILSWYGDDAPDVGGRSRVVRADSCPSADDAGRARLHFEGGAELSVPWDYVLMGCEPEFEWYGGFSEQNLAEVERWMQTHGPFRAPPATT